jgi:hypothetical protein
MELTTDSGCSKISFYMKELKLPFMICWISILRVVIWSRPVSTSVWMAAVGVETTNIVVWVAVGPDPCTPEFEAMAMLWALVETLLRPMVETNPSWVTITGGGVVTRGAVATNGAGGCCPDPVARGTFSSPDMMSRNNLKHS